MRLSELQYDLPPELIAQTPAEPRDAARLLVLHRASGAIEHRTFRDLPAYLRPGDCLAVNNTRVLPARFFCRRRTGGKVEALYLHTDAGRWHLLLKPSARLAIGETLECAVSETRVRLDDRGPRGEWIVTPLPDTDAAAFLGQVGHTPLPPYIHRGDDGPGDAVRYQTVYAERPGAVAAPTAGLHFTPELLAELARMGVSRAAVTLHVGAGTFTPIEVEELAAHRMHAEWFAAPAETLAALAAARRGGGRIVCVGTTTARVLESLALRGAVLGTDAAPPAASGWTDAFLYPPYRFQNVDVMVTNFHLPGTTLLALVMALAGIESVRAAYAAAIAERYRFYSYGDAMLIL